MHKLIWALALAGDLASGATYTVATNGNDANAGTVAAPLRTVAKGASKAVAGDTVQVRTGTYAEAVSIWASGTASAPIRIQAYPGESPVIDGQNRLPTNEWAGLLNPAGAYVEVAGFEVRNSAGLCVRLDGPHDTASGINAHHCKHNGIFVGGDFGIVQDSRVWQASLENASGASGMWSTGLSAARDWFGDKITQGAILRRNVVYANMGEGISSFEAADTRIEDNVVYDNFSVNLYVSDTRGALVQRNLVYNTTAAPLRGGNKASGITLADEVAAKPRSSGNRVINNLIADANLCAFCWTGVAGSTLADALVAHNTIVRGTLSSGPVSGTTRIANNLPNAVVAGGTMGPEYFRLKAAAPVAPIPEVTLDYFQVARTRPTTLGAIEFGVALPPPPPPPEPVYPEFTINIYQRGAQVRQLPVSGDEIRIVPKL